MKNIQLIHNDGGTAFSVSVLNENYETMIAWLESNWDGEMTHAELEEISPIPFSRFYFDETIYP